MTPLPPLERIPDSLRTLADYEDRARAHVEPEAWRHLQDGAGAGLTARTNPAAFDRLRLIPRMLADLRDGTTRLELFGLDHAAPMLLAPIAYQKAFHPEGELAVAAAAAALDTAMVVSTLSSAPLEDIAARTRSAAAELGRAPPSLWFQLYIQPDRAHTQALVRRAEAAGYQVLVVTVDAAIKASDFVLPPGVEAANLKGLPRTVRRAAAADGRILFGTPLLDEAPTWETLAWLRSITRLPLAVKGLLAAEDAGRAMDLGADGIVVSNHGGRVLDGTVHPLDVLPAIADAVAGRGPILLDGGVRRGVDVAKALAAGARAVMIGRPQIHALATAGLPGVAHMLHILRVEFEMAMAQLGCRDLSAIGPQFLSEPRRPGQAAVKAETS